MSFSAQIHTDLESYALIRSDKHTGGNALLSFIGAVENYLSQEPLREIQEWFSTLESLTSEPIVIISKPLLKCYYAADYSMNEYALLASSADSEIAKAEAMTMYSVLFEREASITLLQAVVDTFCQLFKQNDLSESWFYDPTSTLLDFIALQDILGIAKTRGATKIQIQFR